MFSGLRNFPKRSNTVVGIVKGIRADFLQCKRRYWSWSQQSKIRQYLASHEIRKLQIGTWTNVLEGWLNTDLSPAVKGVFFLDAGSVFPFNNGEFDYILSEHQIEHLVLEKAFFMLQECYRVLKPGGKIRVATPDLNAFMNLLVDHPSAVQQKYVRVILETVVKESFIPRQPPYLAALVVNNNFYNPEWGHQFIYDLPLLTAALEKAGFIEIKNFKPGQSDDPHLTGVEGHGKALGDEDLNQYETMVLQGTKPSRPG